MESDNLRFGVDCIKNLLDVREVEASYSTDISRVIQEAKVAATSRGADVQNADVYAITNATLLTMEFGILPRDLVESGTLVIRGGVIENVGPSNNFDIPEGATVHNAQGAFVVPGFIDVHAHWSGIGTSFPSKSWELLTFLAYGVTTMHKFVS